MINIIHSVTIMNRGGQEALIMNMYRNINRSEFNFSFLCSSFYKNEKGDYDDEIIKMGGQLFYPPYYKITNVKFLRRLGEIIATYRFFKTHPQFDILHIHTHHSFYTLGNLIGAKLAGVPHIIVHSHNTNSNKRWLHFLFRPILNSFKIERFACSRQAAYWLFGKKGENALVINNGIEVEKYVFSKEKRYNLRTNLGISMDSFVIGHIGRFNFQKNHSFIIDIFDEVCKINEDSKLILIGKGELENDIREKVKNKGLENNVFFGGVREDIPDLLSCFDVFLFPSLFEGFSVVMIEAQASGIPCVISDTNTKDVVMTNSVKMLSLKLPVEKWASIIISQMNIERPYNLDAIRAAGFDILETVDMVSDKYKLIAAK